MAKRFGVQVYGYDLSVNMINIANDLRMEQKANVKHAVQFYVEDATLMDYPDQFYDMGSIFYKIDWDFESWVKLRQ